MKNIGILVGQDADLPKSKIKNLPVSIFPFVVNWEGYDLMRKAQKNNTEDIRPKTSQPSAQTLYTLFNKNLKIYEDILVITISSALSGTYNAAKQAKKLFKQDFQKRIHIIDSQTSTGSEGLLVLKAAELVHSKQTINKIVEKLKQGIKNTRLLGVFDDPRWLKLGGRINNVQALVVKNMLRAGFRPILTIRNGKITTQKVRREKDKANALFLQFKNEMHNVILIRQLAEKNPMRSFGFQPQDDIRVAITHGDCEKDADVLKKLVQNYNKNITIEFINTISPVVGVHLGPDSLIISWMMKY